MKKGQKTIYITVFLVCVMLSSIIFMQFKTARQTNITDIKNMNEDELKKEIISWQNKFEQTKKQLEETDKKIEEYEQSLSKGEKNSELLNSEYEESLMLAGLTDVEGQGVIITLVDEENQTIISNHLLNLVNELKYAGAEAISINGNRITNFTDIVDVNYIIMVNGIKISSPYEVKAIGNQMYLASTLNAKDGFITTYNETGLNISMKEEKNIQIPKYNKELKLKYGVVNY